MTNFDVSKEWVILIHPDVPGAKKAAAELARYIALLAKSAGIPVPPGAELKLPDIMDVSAGAPPASSPVIIFMSEGWGPERNGFDWRAGTDRIEIFGESGRGLCNGVFNFLESMGISWPAPEQEKFPPPGTGNPHVFPLLYNSACAPSLYQGKNPAAAPWKRFIPAGKKTVKKILKKSEPFAAWAARRRYDALVFPFWAFSGKTGRKIQELKKIAGEYGIAIEAGGRNLSFLVPRKYFFLHRDYFRMEGGKRKMARLFCPTNPGAIGIIGKEGGKIFKAAGDVKVFHLWPDKIEGAVWCSCPTCRAFLPPEQNRLIINAAADVLAGLNPGAFITYFEKTGEGGNIPMRKNLVKMEDLPEETLM